MNGVKDQEPSPEEAALPWYASGKLAEDEARALEARLRTDPELRAHFARVQEERDETIADAERIAAPSARMAARLFAEIDADAARRRTSPLTRWSAVIGDWLGALSPPARGFAAAAAVLAIVIQAAVLATLVTRLSQPVGYETAAGPGQAAGGAVVLIAFQPEARAGDIASLLEQVKAVVIDGPRGGIYRVRIGDAALSGDERQAIMARLRGRQDLVRVVAPAP